MYYLLEDNRIIDSRISYTTNFPYWETKDNCLFAKSKNDKLVRPCNENKIKKQSKNVFDLLENGDLIKYQFINAYYELVSTIELVCKIDIVFKQKEYIGVLGKEVDKNKDTILAIYKPDAKGNYIKVWEVKENE